jgi:hypothetical protein
MIGIAIDAGFSSTLAIAGSVHTCDLPSHPFPVVRALAILLPLARLYAAIDDDESGSATRLVGILGSLSKPTMAMPHGLSAYAWVFLTVQLGLDTPVR